MKQTKKLTRDQAECVRAHYLMAKEWRLIKETEFYLVIYNERTKQRKWIDKFRRKIL